MSEDGTAESITGSEAVIPNIAPAVAPVDFSSIVPAEYADKPWVQDIKDTATLFKMTDDMKSEMGKRPAGIPEAGGDWGEFNKALGVPDTVEGYELNAPAEGGEGFQTAMKEAALALGLRPEQLAGLDAAVGKFNEANPTETAIDPVAFEQITAETFGERKDEVLETAKSLLEAHAPEQFKSSIDGLSNENLTIMASVLDSIQQKYISEGDIPKGDGAVTMGGMSSEAKIAEGTRLMSLPEYSDKGHPNHAEVFEKAGRMFGTFG